MPQDPRDMGGNIAKSIPGVQPAMQGLNWLNQNAVDPVMALMMQLFGGGGGAPGQPMPATGPLPQATGQFDPVTGQQIIKQPPQGGLKGRMAR